MHDKLRLAKSYIPAFLRVSYIIYRVATFLLNGVVFTFALIGYYLMSRGCELGKLSDPAVFNAVAIVSVWMAVLYGMCRMLIYNRFL